jgi:hypothetical protein
MNKKTCVFCTYWNRSEYRMTFGHCTRAGIRAFEDIVAINSREKAALITHVSFGCVAFKQKEE